MSTYSPRVGDRVRRTYLHGTTVEGIIARVDETSWGFDEGEYLLYRPYLHSQVELIERPVPKLVNTPGTIYRHRNPDSGEDVLVRLPDGTWVHSTTFGRKWLVDHEVSELLATGEWELWK